MSERVRAGARWLVGGSVPAAVVRFGVAAGPVVWLGYLALWAGLGIWIGLGNCLGLLGGCSGPREPRVGLVAGSSVALAVLVTLDLLIVAAAWSPSAAWRIVRGPDRRAARRDLLGRP
jgi:hypothetical protein